MGRRWRRQALARARVSIVEIAVVAEFAATRIDDAVAAAPRAAIGTACRVGVVAIGRSGVAILAGIEHLVAAAGHPRQSRVSAAARVEIEVDAARTGAGAADGDDAKARIVGRIGIADAAAVAGTQFADASPANIPRRTAEAVVAGGAVGGRMRFAGIGGGVADPDDAGAIERATVARGAVFAAAGTRGSGIAATAESIVAGIDGAAIAIVAILDLAGERATIAADAVAVIAGFSRLDGTVAARAAGDELGIDLEKGWRLNAGQR